MRSDNEDNESKAQTSTERGNKTQGKAAGDSRHASTLARRGVAVGGGQYRRTDNRRQTTDDKRQTDKRLADGQTDRE